MLQILQFLIAAAPEGAAGEPAQQGGLGQITGMLLPILALGAVFYFIIYRPQKKQERKTRDMRNSLSPGDEITTSGGIIGKVITVKDDTITIESGADRNKIRIQRWAVHSIDKKSESGLSDTIKDPVLPKGAFKVKDVKKADEEQKK